MWAQRDAVSYGDCGNLLGFPGDCNMEDEDEDEEEKKEGVVMSDHRSEE